jgi:branched-chain amino acid transport system substrate-binding protein
MTQKKDTLVLLLSLGITAGIVGTGVWWFSSNQKTPIGGGSVTNSVTNSDLTQRLSYREKSLIPSMMNPEKQLGISAFATGNYVEAIQHFQKSLQINANDPEALIYLNNAKAGQKAVTLALSLPIGTDVNASQELLRGVAQAQTEVNAQGGINGASVKILIANDDEDKAIAEKLGEEFAKNPAILGVIGHSASDTTLNVAKNVYQRQGLPMISPISTSVELSGLGNYIFRTVPSDLFAGTALANYALKSLKKQKVALFYDSQSNYSKSLKTVFSTALLGNGGEVVTEIDFSVPNFNVVDALKQSKSLGAEVAMLAMTTDKSNEALLVIKANQRIMALLAGDEAYKPEILQIGGSDAAGMVVAIPWHVLAHKDTSFVKGAAQLWKTTNINWRTAMAYDAAIAFTTAMKQNATREGIQSALANPNFVAQGASGSIRFLPSGDRNQPIQLVMVKAGKRSGYNYDFVPITNP